jgi:hypothetical protein
MTISDTVSKLIIIIIRLSNSVSIAVCTINTPVGLQELSILLPTLAPVALRASPAAPAPLISRIPA